MRLPAGAARLRRPEPTWSTDRGAPRAGRGPGRPDRVTGAQPGGPGLPGITAAADLATAAPAAELARRFDIVGFVPRGIGSSRPAVRCRPDAVRDAEWAADLAADTSSVGAARFEAQQRADNAACVASTGADVALDARIRAAAPILDSGREPSPARDRCALWPVPPTWGPHRPAVPGLPEVLIVSTLGDPITPYPVGVELARALGAWEPACSPTAAPSTPCPCRASAALTGSAPPT